MTYLSVFQKILPTQNWEIAINYDWEDTFEW